MTTLSIGTIGSPNLLSGEPKKRQSLMDQVSESGIDHLFLADHVSFHNGFGMDGLINAATLAGMNSEINIVLGVYLLALRHPVLVARQLSSLSMSAPGRIVLGVGLGGEDRHEMEVCGVDPSSRGRRTNDSLKALNQLLTGDPSTYECEFFSYSDAIVKPAPSPAIPVVIGGRSNAALKRTGLYGDGWLGLWCSPERYAKAISEVESHAEDCGRAKVAWQHGYQVWIGIDDDKKKARAYVAKQMQHMYQMPFEPFERYSPYGCAEEIAESILPYVNNGASMLNLMPCAENNETEIEKVAEIARLLRSEIN